MTPELVDPHPWALSTGFLLHRAHRNPPGPHTHHAHRRQILETNTYMRAGAHRAFMHRAARLGPHIRHTPTSTRCSKQKGPLPRALPHHRRNSSKRHRCRSAHRRRGRTFLPSPGPVPPPTCPPPPCPPGPPPRPPPRPPPWPPPWPPPRPPPRPPPCPPP